MQSKQPPYLALIDIANRAKAQSKGLPAPREVKPHWTGIGFSVLGHRFIVAMDDVVELLEVPRYTFIPGAQPWVRGVANIRGRLLPIFDLAAFFGGQLNGPRHLRRILVVEYNKLYAGLVVDELHGIQHLALEHAEHAPGNLVEPFAAMVNGQFLIQQDRWLVFDLHALVNDFQFVDAAAH